jgi:hypothetical protein
MVMKSADLTHETKNGERWVIKFQQYLSSVVATAYKIPPQGGFTFKTDTVTAEAESLEAAWQAIIKELDARVPA